jgi:hypothetical protein
VGITLEGLEGPRTQAHISALETVFTVALRVAVLSRLIWALYYYLVRRFDPFHVWLPMATPAVVAIAVIARMRCVAFMGPPTRPPDVFVRAVQR